MSASPPLTKPIFLFPFGHPEGNSLPQFSRKQLQEDYHPSLFSWGGWFWSLLSNKYIVVLGDDLQVIMVLDRDETK